MPTAEDALMQTSSSQQHLVKLILNHSKLRDLRAWGAVQLACMRAPCMSCLGSMHSLLAVLVRWSCQRRHTRFRNTFMTACGGKKVK